MFVSNFDLIAFITRTNIAGNSIGQLGARGLADALRINTTLTSLHVSGTLVIISTMFAYVILRACILETNFDVDGVRALADALKTNTTLTLLNVSRTLVVISTTFCWKYAF